jgi:hypothetical protein
MFRRALSYPRNTTLRRRIVVLLSGASLVLTVAFALPGFGATITDRSGGAIYWGGKYVNIKPSHYGDVIGRRSAVDQMEVLMDNDVMTVKITGPYFFNYVHDVKRTQDAPPGDLYISSSGWKVSGKAPYTSDTFQASEGWDYVVSLENKKAYKLDFPAIRMTGALPYTSKYRAHQAWRGGYGEAIDEADVTLTDSGLTFVFSVRNMRLESEIGLHWTMKCGNDILEGSALIPPIAVAMADPASADPVGLPTGDALAADPAAPDLPPIPVGAPAIAGAAMPAFPAAVGSSGSGFIVPAVLPILPIVTFGSDDDSGSSGGSGGGSSGGGQIVPYNVPDDLVTPVPEPSLFFLLCAGLSGILLRKHLVR